MSSLSPTFFALALYLVSYLWVVDAFFTSFPQSQLRRQYYIDSFKLKLAGSNIQSSSHWQIWKTLDSLEKNSRSTDINSSREQLIKNKIIPVLSTWGKTWAGEKDWQGILNKSTLLHEVEECIVALSHLNDYIETISKKENKTVTIVDVCCGKGIFSMLASYIFRDDNRVEKIIMLDKAKTINWNHVKIINKNAFEEHRPKIETWNCNLHDIDQVVTRLENEYASTTIVTNQPDDSAFDDTIANPLDYESSSNTTLALVGIHLCKLLSPSLIGIFNCLDPSYCPFLILAPCCIPRAVMSGRRALPQSASTSIEVRQFETKVQREARRLAKEKRDAAMNRTRMPSSSSNSPPPTMNNMGDQINLFDSNHKKTVQGACWICGETGHLKADCPNTQTTGKPKLIKPNTLQIDVSRVLNSEQPFDVYCHLLSSSIQRDNIKVLKETGLTIPKYAEKNKKTAERKKGNWNNDRKSTYIIALGATT